MRRLEWLGHVRQSVPLVLLWFISVYSSSLLKKNSQHGGHTHGHGHEQDKTGPSRARAGVTTAQAGEGGGTGLGFACLHMQKELLPWRSVCLPKGQLRQMYLVLTLLYVSTAQRWHTPLPLLEKPSPHGAQDKPSWFGRLPTEHGLCIFASTATCPVQLQDTLQDETT